MSGRRRGSSDPPRAWTALVQLLLPADDAEAVLGDLEEEYRERVLPERGRRAARSWYRRMALDSVRHRMGRRRSTAARPRGAGRPTPSGALERLRQDASYGVRQLLRWKALSAAVVATLAVTLGANTTMFAVVDGALLEPLPYPDADGIVTVWQANAENPDARGLVSVPNFRDWRARSRRVAPLATVDPTTLTFTGAGTARTVSGARVSDGFFEVFRSPPAPGRGPSADEARPDGEDVVVVSRAFWRDALGADADVLGRTVTLDGRPHRIVGVAPEGFDYPAGADLWVADPLDTEGCGRGCVNQAVVGRLAGGATLASAQEEFGAIARAMAADHGLEGYRVNVVSLREVEVGDVRGALGLLLGAVVLVLLVACANVAGLLLARGELRASELAVRAALGAGRGRLMGQLLVEAALLAVCGAAAGLALAAGGLALLRERASVAVPRLEDAALDGSVLLYTLGALAVATILFGLAPAVATSRLPVAEWLRSSGSRGATRRPRTRAVLVAGQVALSTVLVLGTTLLLRTVLEIRSVSLGFEDEDVRVMSFFVPEAEVPAPAEVVALHEAFRDRLEGLPGVESVGAALGAPLSGISVHSSVDVEGWAGAERPPNAGIRTVTPGYFETLEIPLRAGRPPQPVDGLDGARVAWVNETAARAWWPGEDPLGHRIDVAASVGLPESEPRTVVGVVADTRFRGAREDVPLEVYVPHGQNASRSLEYFVRLRDGAPPPYPAARRALAELHPALPLDDDGPLAARTAAARADTRLWTWLMGGFGVLALGLAALGLFAVVAQQVTERRREIGIRMAMGARGKRVVRRLVGEGLRPAVLGVVAGLLLAAFGVGLLEGLLFGVEPGDPWAWGASVVVLVAVAAAASLWPASRAVRVDPVEVLRAR